MHGMYSSTELVAFLALKDFLDTECCGYCEGENLEALSRKLCVTALSSWRDQGVPEKELSSEIRPRYQMRPTAK